ncbi:MAG: hypothetical protein ABSC72_04680 [Methylovirgula sp.]|jgi:hypothetical protein
MNTQNGAIRAPSFAEVLDDVALGTETRSSSLRFANVSGQDWLSSLLKTHTGVNEPPRANVEAAFFADEDVVPPFDRFEADEMLRIDVETVFDMDEGAIAAELGLKAARSVAALRQARRAFALRNHPDRFHPSLRDKANQRMQLANMLLDRRRKEIEAGR